MKKIDWKTVAITLIAASIGYGQTLTLLTLENKSTTALRDYPLTFGLPFAPGALNKSTETVVLRIAGQVITTQMDAKTSWGADGSLKFGIVSILIPSLGSRDKIRIEVVKAPAASNAADKEYLEPAAFRAQNVQARISLSNLAGNLQGDSLEADISTCADGDLKPWLRGSVVTEYICTKRLSNALGAEWEVRVYPEASHRVRVSHSLENDFLQYLGTVRYDARIEQGRGDLVPVYSKAGVVHNYGGRWRKVVWLGQAPPETELRYDPGYLEGTGLLPPYGQALQVPESRIASDWTRWQAAAKDIMDPGTILKYFPTTGGREEIGLLPAWTARYLVTQDNRLRAIMMGNAELAGSVPAHYKESDPALSFAGRVANIDDRPNLNYYGFNNPSAGTGGAVFTGEMDPNGWYVDRAHQGDFAFVPYLITGDYWLLQEVFYWASFNLATQAYARQGSKGLLIDQYRAHAWAMRSLGHAASITPDDAPEKAYFSSKLQNNLDYDTDMNIGAKGHPLHILLGQDYDPTSRAGFSRIFAPWQHDFNVLVYAHLARQGFPRAAVLRDTLGLFTIGRFSNDPAFPRYAGAGYWWPLLRLDRTMARDWASLWEDAALYEGRDPNVPVLAEEMVKEDYAHSYPYIARAALACLAHLPESRKAYDFLSSTFPNRLMWLNENPAFGFSHGEDPLLDGYVPVAARVARRASAQPKPARWAWLISGRRIFKTQ